MVPDDHKGNYVLIRAESELDSSNRERFVTNGVIVIEIVTQHQQLTNAETVELIDNEVRQRIFPTRKTIGLPPVNDTQVLNVKMSDAFYDNSFAGALYIHRKICRYNNRIIQLN